MATKLTKKTSLKVKPIKKSPLVKTSGRNMTTPKIFTSGLGRRKTATARVRLFEGKQTIMINGLPVNEYWPGKSHESLYLAPFIATNTLNRLSATAKITGSGTTGQIGAFVHAVARAMVKLDSEKYKPVLRENGLLTRDPRMKETRKAGQAGKARFKKQSPKR